MKPDSLRHIPATYRQIDWWIRRGYLLPDNPNPGSGAARIWTNDELGVLRRMALLVKAGLSPEIAAKAARAGTEAWLSPSVKVNVIE